MDTSKESRHAAIYIKQTDQLYNSLRFSAVGSVLVALVLAYILAPKSSPQVIWSWFFALLAINAYRSFDTFRYGKLNPAVKALHNWRRRFSISTYLAAITWASSMWLFYPIDYPEYQVLMILGLAGIAGGAVSTLSYDKTIITAYLSILLIGIDSRLLWEGGQFSYELAVLLLLYIAFLMKGGRDIGNSNYELLVLRLNSEDQNLALLSTTEQMARIGYWQWDMESSEIELSANLASMIGAHKRHDDLDSLLKKVHDDDQKRVQSTIEDVRITGQENSLEFRVRDPNDENWIIMNQVIKRISDLSGKHFLLGTVQDISVIKSAEQKIFDMAYYDELTGLANRGHLCQHLIEQIKRSTRNQLKPAILYLNLDGFKEINDAMGYDKGDEYLKIFSQRLKQYVRDEDFVARLGGDEFCIVLSDTTDEVTTAKAAERYLTMKNEPIIIENQSISPQMSIGIAVYPHDGTDVETLLRAADTAMFSARKKGKHCFAFYDPQMTMSTEARLELESDLKQALSNNEFKLVYQPKVSLRDGLITGVEALIRWHHPVRGMVPPDDFISTAERIGLINDIGEWVLATACEQLQQWKSQGLQLSMAVNISSSHFSSRGFVTYVEKVKQQFDIEIEELEIEITESLTRDPLHHTQVCKELRLKGVKVAIDDFGTGYSSLSVLKELHIDTLKIDRAFIQHLPSDQVSALMIRAIITMALGMGVEVVAEGVETQEQAHYLKKLGCPYVQGYYFSRPIAAEEIPELLESPFLLSKSQASN
jgi:diguanylate cyclase (GGDEF)-like protein